MKIQRISETITAGKTIGNVSRADTILVRSRLRLPVSRRDDSHTEAVMQAKCERRIQLVGESPQTYVTRARMHRATRLLQEKGNSLSDIALATGYESDSSFTKAFSRLYGKPPGQYRRDSLV